MEEWKPVKGFEGHYDVSSEGRVRSLPRKRYSYGGREWMQPGRIVKPTEVVDKGYLVVSLCMDGYKRRHYVHSLVLTAFVGERPTSSDHTRHLDGNPANNRVENLKWGTPKENGEDKATHGSQKGTKHHRNRYSETQIRQAKALLDLGTMTLREVQAATGIPVTTLSQVKHGRQWAHLFGPTSTSLRSTSG